jgi:putative MFS transporter
VSLPRHQVIAAAFCSVGFGIDLLEITLGNAFSAIFSAPPHSLAPDVLSWLLAAPYVGAVVGAPLLGWAAEAKGYRLMLMIALLWIGAFSLAGASSPAVGWLIGSRLLAGLALGAYPPLMIAYLTATTSPVNRGKIIFAVCAVAYLAPPGGIFLVKWLTPAPPLGIEAWRWPLALAGALALLAAIAFLRLPDAPKVNAKRLTLRSLADRRFAFVSAMYALHPLASVAFPLLTGPVLLARGFGITDTLLYVGLATFGPVIGTLGAGFLVDRIERRTTIAICAASMLTALALFFATAYPILLMAAVVLFNVFASLYSPAMTTYGAELYPDGSRAAATSAAWALNRIVAAGAPLILLPLLHPHGAAPLAATVCVSLLLTMVLMSRRRHDSSQQAQIFRSY